METVGTMQPDASSGGESDIARVPLRGVSGSVKFWERPRGDDLEPGPLSQPPQLRLEEIAHRVLLRTGFHHDAVPDALDLVLHDADAPVAVQDAVRPADERLPIAVARSWRGPTGRSLPPPGRSRHRTPAGRPFAGAPARSRGSGSRRRRSTGIRGRRTSAGRCRRVRRPPGHCGCRRPRTRRRAGRGRRSARERSRPSGWRGRIPGHSVATTRQGGDVPAGPGTQVQHLVAMHVEPSCQGLDQVAFLVVVLLGVERVVGVRRRYRRRSGSRHHLPDRVDHLVRLRVGQRRLRKGGRGRCAPGGPRPGSARTRTSRGTEAPGWRCMPRKKGRVSTPRARRACASSLASRPDRETTPYIQ